MIGNILKISSFDLTDISNSLSRRYHTGQTEGSTQLSSLLSGSSPMLEHLDSPKLSPAPTPAAPAKQGIHEDESPKTPASHWLRF